MEKKNEEKFVLPKDRPGYKPSIRDIPIGEIIPDEVFDLEDIKTESVQEQHLEKIARGYIMGTNRISKRKDIKEKLEARVIEKIGKKGKYLSDKLFELIEGIYIVSSDKGGNIKYYKQPPNLQAIMYALDRVLGKPGSAEKENAESQGTTTVEQIIKSFADGTKEETKKVTVQK